MAQILVPVILGLTQAHVAIGLPTTRLTQRSAVATVGWVSDPNGRGTFSLLISCLATMLLCVWSALHLNIPEAGQNQAKFWLRNIKWMLLGLVGPELVVFSAWRQFNSAKTLQGIIQQIAKDRKASLTNAEGEDETVQVSETRCEDILMLTFRSMTDLTRLTMHMTTNRTGLSCMDFMLLWAVLSLISMPVRIQCYLH